MEGGNRQTYPGQSSSDGKLRGKGIAVEEDDAHKNQESNFDGDGVDCRGDNSEGSQEAPVEAAGARAKRCKATEQDLNMPITIVHRIMRKVLPSHAKIAEDVKETVQRCVSEFIAHVTTDANERCREEQRITVTAEDVLRVLGELNFDEYVNYLTKYLHHYRMCEGNLRPARRDLLGLSARPPAAASNPGLYGATTEFQLGIHVDPAGVFPKNVGSSSAEVAASTATDVGLYAAPAIQLGLQGYSAGLFAGDAGTRIGTATNTDAELYAAPELQFGTCSTGFFPEDIRSSGFSVANAGLYPAPESELGIRGYSAGFLSGDVGSSSLAAAANARLYAAPELQSCFQGYSTGFVPSDIESSSTATATGAGFCTAPKIQLCIPSYHGGFSPSDAGSSAAAAARAGLFDAPELQMGVQGYPERFFTDVGSSSTAATITASGLGLYAAPHLQTAIHGYPAGLFPSHIGSSGATVPAETAAGGVMLPEDDHRDVQSSQMGPSQWEQPFGFNQFTRYNKGV